VLVVNKGLPALLALVLALHASIGCRVVRAAVTMEAPCCGQNCPMGSSVGESVCCHSQDSGVAAEEISRPSIPAVHPLVGLMPALIVRSVRIPIEQTCLFEGNSPGASQLALLCSRQI
jgi:hypothetical protein